MLAGTKLFRLFQIFFKVEAEVLPYIGSLFFNTLYSANASRFPAYGNSIFLVRAFLLLLEIISVIQSGSFFRLLERFISVKSFIPASRNEFFVYWKKYCFILSFFLLVENVIETWGKSIFKDQIQSCQGTPIFSIFSAISRFF